MEKEKDNDRAFLRRGFTPCYYSSKVNEVKTLPGMRCFAVGQKPDCRYECFVYKPGPPPAIQHVWETK